jgi:streptogramin lyase
VTLGLTLAVAACSSGSVGATPDGSSDAQDGSADGEIGTSGDGATGTPDAPSSDARSTGTSDGAPETGASDAGAVDTGASDASAADTGASDGGVADAATSDTGAPDSAGDAGPDATLETDSGTETGDGGTVEDAGPASDAFTGIPSCPVESSCVVGDAAAPRGQVCGPNAQCYGTACVTAITGTGTPAFPVGTTYSGTVMTVMDVFASSLSASIDWGDGTNSTGTVTGPTAERFTVSGSHEYTRRGSVLVTVTVTDSSGGVSTAITYPAAVGASYVTEVGVAIDGGGPNGTSSIATGSDGNLWFTETSTSLVGRVNTSGTALAQFSFSSGGAPFGIASGADGNLWVTLPGIGASNWIGRITTAGVSATFPVPSENAFPEQGIVAGPGGMWFSEEDTNQIATIPYDGGAITEYPITHGSEPNAIVPGPDGNLWFVLTDSNSIGSMTPQGVSTTYPIAGTTCNPGDPVGIAAGSDGALWFTESTQDGTGAFIGRITTGGTLAYLPYPLTNGQPGAMVAGPDEALWFVDMTANVVGRVTTAGLFTFYVVPTADARPEAITVGPDGNLWFTESREYSLGYVSPP